MVKGVFDEMKKAAPKNHFTVGINDDVSHSSLDYDPAFQQRIRRRYARCSMGWVLTARLAPTRTRSRSSQRDAELRAGLLCVRLKEVRLDGLPRTALRANRSAQAT